MPEGCVGRWVRRSSSQFPEAERFLFQSVRKFKVFAVTWEKDILPEGIYAGWKNLVSLYCV